MKKVILPLIFSMFLLASCGGDKPAPEPGPEPCPEGTHVDSNHDTYCDVCGVQFVFDYNHALRCKGNPNSDFQIGVGETKVIEAVLDPVPYRYSERDFTWKNSNSSVCKMEINKDKTAQVTITALKVGNVKLTATNTYNSELVHEFNIRVINYDAESMYLWQYNSDAGDRAQFGYNSKDATAGTAKGTAVLGGLKWKYERSNVTSLQSDSGSLGFGKGKAPETSVKLSAKNDRTVKRVSLETASANGLANVVVKVGDTEVINKATPSSASDGVQEVSSAPLEDLAGDISIEFTTPEYDASRAEDPEYRAPGAVYLKSIFVEFSNKYEYKTEQSYDFEAKYKAGTDDPDFSKLTATAKELVISDDDFDLKFEKISKDDKDQGLAITNGYIDLKVKNDKEIVKMVEFEYVNYSSSNTYNLYQSVIGGEPYFENIGGNKTGKISFVIYDTYVDSIRLIPAGTAKVGLKSLKIKTIEGSRAVVKSVALEDGAKPTTVDYYVGEKFNPAGLGDVIISFENEDLDDINYGTENLVWYDGQSYENPADHSGASEILREGTTYVVSTFLNTEIKVDITEVTNKVSHFSKIKSVDDLVNGNYLITAPSKKAVLKGSATDIKAKAAVETISDCGFGDLITLNYLFENDMFNLEKSGDYYQIKSVSSGKYVGMTKSGNTSYAKSPEYSNWQISISDDGIATLMISDGADLTKYYGFKSTTFDLQDADPSNISFFKIAD